MVYLSGPVDLKDASYTLVRVLDRTGNLLKPTTEQLAGFSEWKYGQIKRARDHGVDERDGALMVLGDASTGHRPIGTLVYMSDMLTTDVTTDSKAVLSSHASEVMLVVADDVFLQLRGFQVTALADLRAKKVSKAAGEGVVFSKDKKEVHYVTSTGERAGTFCVARLVPDLPDLPAGPPTDEDLGVEATFDEDIATLLTAATEVMRVRVGDDMFPLRDHQALAVMKWQKNRLGGNSLTEVDGHLMYIDMSGALHQIVAVNKSLPSFTPTPPGCRFVAVDILALVPKRDVSVMKSDFAGYYNQDGSAPAYQTGDHLLDHEAFHGINARFLELARREFGSAVVAQDATRPRFLVNGGNHDPRVRVPHAVLWTEPILQGRKTPYWPAYSALKATSLVGGMGHSASVVEGAAKLLGYLTVYEVKNADAYYATRGPAILVNHDSPSIPPECAKLPERFCSRIGYTKVQPANLVDAVIIHYPALVEADVRPVLVIAITNKQSRR